MLNVLPFVERFTIINADTITYEATVDDSKTFLRPWKMAGAFTRADKDYELLEHACYEGNKDLWLQFPIPLPLPSPR